MELQDAAKVAPIALSESAMIGMHAHIRPILSSKMLLRSVRVFVYVLQ